MVRRRETKGVCAQPRSPPDKLLGVRKNIPSWRGVAHSFFVTLVIVAGLRRGYTPEHIAQLPQLNGLPVDTIQRLVARIVKNGGSAVSGTLGCHGNQACKIRPVHILWTRVQLLATGDGERGGQVSIRTLVRDIESIYRLWHSHNNGRFQKSTAPLWFHLEAAYKSGQAGVFSGEP